MRDLLGLREPCKGRPCDLGFRTVKIGGCSCDPGQGLWWLAEDSGRNEGGSREAEPTGLGEGRGVKEGSFLFWAIGWVMGPFARGREGFVWGEGREMTP